MSIRPSQAPRAFSICGLSAHTNSCPVRNADRPKAVVSITGSDVSIELATSHVKRVLSFLAKAAPIGPPRQLHDSTSDGKNEFTETVVNLHRSLRAGFRSIYAFARSKLEQAADTAHAGDDGTMQIHDGCA